MHPNYIIIEARVSRIVDDLCFNCPHAYPYSPRRAYHEGRSSLNGLGYFAVLRLGLRPFDLLTGRACFPGFHGFGAMALANNPGSLRPAKSVQFPHNRRPTGISAPLPSNDFPPQFST